MNILNNLAAERAKPEATACRLDEHYRWVIDQRGQKVRLDDPRVVHVFTFAATCGPYRMALLASLFGRRGWRLRIPPPLTADVLKRARKLCSGRECFPLVALAGLTMRDLEESRTPGEITLYHNHDEDIGNCQFAAWPVAWRVFSERLRTEDVLFLPRIALVNDYLGQGIRFALENLHALLIGDLLDEASGVVRILGRDPRGIEEFDEATLAVCQSAAHGIGAMKRALAVWANRVSRIPLRTKLEEIPKILLFGGLNLFFMHQPLAEYLESQGVVARTHGIYETICFAETMHVVRYLFKQGFVRPDEQLDPTSLVRALARSGGRGPGSYLALRARLNLAGAQRAMRTLRRIAGASGLVYSDVTPFREIVEAGHQRVSFNGLTETSLTLGSYACAARSDIYDGFVNATAFNCQASVNGQALIANEKARAPLVSLEMDGLGLSSNQERLLEALAVQARSYHAARAAPIDNTGDIRSYRVHKPSRRVV